jgi:tetratricopeptide (TPR) repeat protein
MQSFLRSRALWILALALTLPSSLRAEEGILAVHVEDTKGSPVSGVEIAPKGDGAPGAPTDRLGKTRLRLAPATRPGQWVTLQILPKKSGPDWVFVSPWNQRTLVPSFANESENYVPAVLGERGNRDLLTSDQALKAMAARTLEQIGPRLDKSEITQEERKRVLTEQAAAFGLKPEEVDQAIRVWGVKATDPYDAGLAALYERNYPKAAERLEASLEGRRKELNAAKAKIAEAALFLGKARYEQGQYKEAISAYRESLEAGGEHLSVLYNLGQALLDLGDLEGAKLHLHRALEISETSLGREHPDVATNLNSLALLDVMQGRYSDAESLYQRSLQIREKALGSEHPLVSTSLNNLASLYEDQGRYSDAEPLYRRSLAIREKTVGPEDPKVGTILNNLALLLDDQERYSEAESLHQRALKIAEKSLGSDHPEFGAALHNLAALYYTQGRFSEALPLFERTLKIWEKVFGTEDLNVAMCLNNLGKTHDALQRYPEAEPLFQRALKIREKALGPDHPDVTTNLNNLAMLYHKQKKLDTAESFAKRALAAAEKSFGACHAGTSIMLENYAAVLIDLGRAEEAQPLLDRVKAIKTGGCSP